MQYERVPTCTIADYLRAKREHPLAIVFLRSGDFYEAFGSDAVVASRELDLVILTRKTGKDQAQQMACFPHHTAETYAQRLREKGYHHVILGDLEPDTHEEAIMLHIIRHDDADGPATNHPALLVNTEATSHNINVDIVSAEDATRIANVYIEYRGGVVMLYAWGGDDLDGEPSVKECLVPDIPSAIKDRKEQDHE